MEGKWDEKRRKKEEIFGEGRYSFCGGEEEWKGKMRNVLREGKYFFCERWEIKIIGEKKI